MANDYIPVIVSVSVLGGIVLIALIVVCILRIVSRSSTSQQRYGDTMALKEPQEPPSYVHYPAPEPYTPTLVQEDPWRAGFHDNPAREMNHTHDNMDSALPPGPHGVPRRPSPLVGQYRPPSVPDIPRQHSYAQDMPRRSSYAQVMPRRSSYAQDMPRRSSYAQNMPRRSSYAQDMPRRSSYAQDMPRRSSYAQDMPRRSSYAQDIFRRPSNAEGVSRRPSLTQGMPEKSSHIEFRRTSARDQAAQRAPMHASLTPIPEIPSGHHDKLLYFYLQEDPSYFTDEALMRNKKQPRVWRGEKREKDPSSAAPRSLHPQSPEARARWM